MARRGFEIEGMEELQRAVIRMGKVPQKVSGRAARAGAVIAHRAAKGEAPDDTGELKNALVIRREKRKKQGKTVYDIIVDPDKSDEVFVKRVENPSPFNRGNDPTRAYYPASQEYGYMTESGKFIPGFHYFRKSFEANKAAIEKKIIDVGITEIDKAWEAR